MKRAVQLASTAMFVAMITALPASGQSRISAPVDASIGYQVLHLPDETFPFGLNLDISGAFNNGWRAVGEFGFATDSQNEPGVTGDLKHYHFGAGPRLVASAAGVQPYVQLLAGAVHTRAALAVGGVPVDDADWAFMLQPGVGVNVPAGNVLNVFGQADYRRAFFKEQGENEFRFSFGVRFTVR